MTRFRVSMISSLVFVLWITAGTASNASTRILDNFPRLGSNSNTLSVLLLSHDAGAVSIPDAVTKDKWCFTLGNNCKAFDRTRSLIANLDSGDPNRVWAAATFIYQPLEFDVIHSGAGDLTMKAVGNAALGLDSSPSCKNDTIAWLKLIAIENLKNESVVLGVGSWGDLAFKLGDSLSPSGVGDAIGKATELSVLRWAKSKNYSSLASAALAKTASEASKKTLSRLGYLSDIPLSPFGAYNTIFDGLINGSVAAFLMRHTSAENAFLNVTTYDACLTY